MEGKRRRELEGLIRGWEIRLESLDLLDQALTHPTYVFENKGRPLVHNQRLEFLGDAILGLVVADHLFRCHGALPEGELTKMRAALVCEASLADRGRALDLGRYLLLGRGEDLSGGRERPSNLADAFEAVLGAIYLDRGYPEAAAFIAGQMAATMSALKPGHYGDYKTTLQELVQGHGEESVSYRIIGESGPDHQKLFLAGVYYRGSLLAQGSGGNKKEAEQKAAQAAIDCLGQWRHLLLRTKG